MIDPLTLDRIEKTQKNIEILLPPRPEYVINTSEYEDVRVRVEGRSRKLSAN